MIKIRLTLLWFHWLILLFCCCLTSCSDYSWDAISVSVTRQVCETFESSSREMRHFFHWLCKASREKSEFCKLKVLSQYHDRIADQLSSDETMMSKKRKKARDFRTTELSKEMIQCVLKKSHLKLICETKKNTQDDKSDKTSVLLTSVVEQCR